MRMAVVVAAPSKTHQLLKTMLPEEEYKRACEDQAIVLKGTRGLVWRLSYSSVDAFKMDDSGGLGDHVWGACRYNTFRENHISTLDVLLMMVLTLKMGEEGEKILMNENKWWSRDRKCTCSACEYFGVHQQGH